MSKTSKPTSPSTEIPRSFDRTRADPPATPKAETRRDVVDLIEDGRPPHRDLESQRDHVDLPVDFGPSTEANSVLASGRCDRRRTVAPEGRLGELLERARNDAVTDLTRNRSQIMTAFAKDGHPIGWMSYELRAKLADASVVVLEDSNFRSCFPGHAHPDVATAGVITYIRKNIAFDPEAARLALRHAYLHEVAEGAGMPASKQERFISSTLKTLPSKYRPI